jgi:hypothetical protein
MLAFRNILGNHSINPRMSPIPQYPYKADHIRPALPVPQRIHNTSSTESTETHLKTSLLHYKQTTVWTPTSITLPTSAGTPHTRRQPLSRLQRHHRTSCISGALTGPCCQSTITTVDSCLPRPESHTGRRPARLNRGWPPTKRYKRLLGRGGRQMRLARRYV